VITDEMAVEHRFLGSENLLNPPTIAARAQNFS
jgi:hypothetical protein